MKANHNGEDDNAAATTAVLNIRKSKNESKSQQEEARYIQFGGCVKYQEIKE